MCEAAYYPGGPRFPTAQAATGDPQVLDPGPGLVELRHPRPLMVFALTTRATPARSLLYGGTRDLTAPVH